MKNSTKIEDIMRGSGTRLENHGKITLYANTKKKMLAFLDDPLNLCTGLRSKNVHKWEAAMQKKYDLFMTKST